MGRGGLRVRTVGWGGGGVGVARNGIKGEESEVCNPNLHFLFSQMRKVQ